MPLRAATLVVRDHFAESDELRDEERLTRAPPPSINQQEADEPAEALALLRQAAAILAGVAADSEARAEVQFALARALRATGRGDEAREAALTAARLWRELGAGFAREAADAEAISSEPAI